MREGAALLCVYIVKEKTHHNTFIAAIFRTNYTTHLPRLPVVPEGVSLDDPPFFLLALEVRAAVGRGRGGGGVAVSGTGIVGRATCDGAIGAMISPTATATATASGGGAISTSKIFSSVVGLLTSLTESLSESASSNRGGGLSPSTDFGASSAK